LLYQNNKLKAILDTKYKMRDLSNLDFKAGVSQVDIYQMVSYSIGRGCENCYLIYPENSYENLHNAKEPVTFSISSRLLDSSVIKIKAINIPVTSERGNYSEMKADIEKDLKKKWNEVILDASKRVILQK